MTKLGTFWDEVTDERRKWDAMLDKQADIKRSDDQIHPQAEWPVRLAISPGPTRYSSWIPV